MTRLAIVGAGMAGIAAARQVRALRPEMTITIFEKSKEFGGRAATRRRDGFTYDYGAQYFKTPQQSELASLVLQDLPRDHLHDIGRDVWVFDQRGTIAPGDPDQNSDPKWTYTGGISQLSKLLVQHEDMAQVTVRRQTHVGRLRPGMTHRFGLDDETGQPLGEADAVLMAIPAEQAADLIAASKVANDMANHEKQQYLIDALRHATYSRCLTVIIAVTPRPPEQPYYALVNPDRGHAISWLAFEHDKGPDRTPGNAGLLVVQMGRQYSLDQYDAPSNAICRDVVQRTELLLNQSLGEVLWTDLQRWRYALPIQTMDSASVNGLLDGLNFAGDFLRGGRVHLAVESGIETGKIIAAEVGR